MVPCAAVWRARTAVRCRARQYGVRVRRFCLRLHGLGPPVVCLQSRGLGSGGLPPVVEIGLAHIRVRPARRCVIASVPPHRDCMMCPSGRVGCNA